MFIASMVGGVNFVLYVPVLLTAYMELAEQAKPIIDREPEKFPLKYFKEQIQKGVAYKV